MPVIPLVPLSSFSTDVCPVPYCMDCMAWLLRLEDMPLIELGTRADMDDRPPPTPPPPPPPPMHPDPAEEEAARAAAAATLCEPRLVPLRLVLAPPPPLGSVEASDWGRLE